MIITISMIFFYLNCLNCFFKDICIEHIQKPLSSPMKLVIISINLCRILNKLGKEINTKPSKKSELNTTNIL